MSDKRKTAGSERPVIGITMGDPAGIGPEVALKAFAEKSVYEKCRPVLVGDARVMEFNRSIVSKKLKISPIQNVEDAAFNYGTIDVLDLKNVKMEKLEYAQISAMAGKAAFEAVKKVIDLALANKLEATVTGPIHKESINKAGYQFAGHTEIYAHFTKTTDFAMLLVYDDLRVIHVSTHVSVREACDLVRKDRIVKVARLIRDACQDFGIENPKIGIAGLNPHASDGGLFGNEEKQEIIPAVEQLRSQGIRVEGPIPPDILFPMAAGGCFDGCVAMYHDQGHIPFKLIGFKWDKEKQQMGSVKGVNITLGLPIIRTSVDHGTAFEIAGKGVASPEAMLNAIDYATRIAIHKREK